jgi:hypothetical protein
MSARREAVAANFRHFAIAAAPVSPLYARLAERIAGDAALLALAAQVELERQPSNLLLAAVHRRLMERPGDPLARFYADLTPAPLPPEGAFADFRRFALAEASALAPLLASRRTSTNEIQRAAVLLPALAVATADGRPAHIIEVGCSAGFLLGFDRLAYDYGAAGRIGAAEPALTLSCRAEGALPLPARLPRVASRVGLDLMPLDAADAEDAAWLEALVWPEQAARRQRLRRALALTAGLRPRLVAGDAAETFQQVAAALPPEGPVVVFHAFALVQFPAAAKVRLLSALEDLAARRTVWRVSYEHAAGAFAELRLQRHGAEGEARLLAEAAPHGDWMRWQA